VSVSIRVRNVSEPEETVPGLGVGDRIVLRRARFEKLATAFFGEIEQKFM
jgi:hypothetical protein